MYDLVIIGGGPAGVAAGIYAARKRLKTLFITESFGGQSVESVGIENWIGTHKISGADFSKLLEDHLRLYEGDTLTIESGVRVDEVTKDGEIFKVRVGENVYESRSVLVTTGSTRRHLDIPGAREFENKGISYCASCDGPLFTGQDVAVIGGGNAGFETAAQLLAYAKSVTLIHRGPNFKADKITVDRVLSHPNMKAVTNSSPTEVRGDVLVNSLVYKNSLSGEETELPVTGIFVEIGLLPTTGIVKHLVELNEFGQIPIDPKTQRTEIRGLWAAGDSTNSLYHQNNIAAGDAVRAVEDIYLYLRA